MVENSDEIDTNPSPEYQDAMSSTSTTALFSQQDALKCIIICVIYWNIVLISKFQYEVPIWFYTNSVCTAEGKRRSSHLLTCAWKSCIINEMRQEGPRLGRWSSRISLLIWSPTVNSSASIFQMHQVQGKIHLPKTTVWLKIKTCNLQCVKCQCSWNASWFYEYSLQFKCYHVTRIRIDLKNKGIKFTIPDGLWFKNINKCRVRPLLIKYHFSNLNEWPTERDGLYVMINMLVKNWKAHSFLEDWRHWKCWAIPGQAALSLFWHNVLWDLKRCLLVQHWPSLTCFFSWIFTEYYILLRFFLYWCDSSSQLPTTVSISFLQTARPEIHFSSLR